ncbi:hypothetical protein C4D60_Mb03t22390 [Musa balbisiana]|uniref:Uncharacterized protein n=1 Tax=Musa balbisiana TaxID=52838 RepID=A0A4S8JE84_MUSBA|nr:hypothetical protein C4D60_Mb03t22390 [Musa balbisiana]
MEELPLHPRGKMAKVVRNVHHQMFARHDLWSENRPSSGTKEGSDLEPEVASRYREKDGHFLNHWRFGSARGKKRGLASENLDSGTLSNHEKVQLDGQWRFVCAVSPLYRLFLVDAAALCMILREPGGEECKRHQGCPVMWWFKSAAPPSIHPSIPLLGSLSFTFFYPPSRTSLFPVAFQLMGDERDYQYLP